MGKKDLTIEIDEMIDNVVQHLDVITKQIAHIEADAFEKGTIPAEFRYPDGRYVMADLYLAKSQMLSSLIMLRNSRPSRYDSEFF